MQKLATYIYSFAAKRPNSQCTAHKSLIPMLQDTSSNYEAQLLPATKAHNLLTSPIHTHYYEKLVYTLTLDAHTVIVGFSVLIRRQ